MSSYRFERLSAQDAAFLAAEGPNTHMHVGAVFLAESGGLKTEEGGVDIQRVRDFIAARLHRIPRYRQRLAYTPLRGIPVWIDDEHFHIDYHVRHTSLPRPGTDDQLKKLIARITSQQLDRRRPLWETWVVEGLDYGNRLALITKVHHCMIDGAAGSDLMMVLMSLDPNEEIGTAPSFVPRPHPSALELMRDDVGQVLTGPFEMAQRVRESMGETDPRDALRGVGELVRSGLSPAPSTPINLPIGPHRRFDWIVTDLDDVKMVKDKLGGTVNDVVLTVVAGAVRSFLRYRRVDVTDIDFKVSAPVSMRSPSDKGAMGNRVSAWIVPLPVGEDDPMTRLELVREATGHLKGSQGALGADVLSAVTEWTGTTLLSLGTRLQNVFLPANMIVTNVPGPQIPLYLVGAKLLETFPIVPLFASQGLGIALFSYDGRLCWGLNADHDVMADLREFRTGLQTSFDELRTLAGIPVS
ncbi:MAG: wax ester/triacylglycerol synthase family O-acyltransferase [bacterium]|nr:wax ester/triacylglycerol synthase family O-acyltransferase [bacterium]